MAIDAVVRKSDGSFVEVQIKARSRGVKPGTEALFSVIHHKLREKYWFVFYSERLERMWIMTSQEFVAESGQTKKGKFEGLRYINLKAKRFGQYIAKDFGPIEQRPPIETEDDA
jgi:hypothetical protein